DDDSRYIDFDIAIAVLAEVQHVRLHFFDQQFEIAPRFLDIALRNFHPLQAIFSRTIINPIQRVHPRGLVRQRKFAEADKSDAMPRLREPGDELLCVRPDPTDRVGGDQYVHSRSSIGTGCWSCMSLKPLSRNALK